jgi:hypothetical protein
MKEGVTCPNCGHHFEGHDSRWGKVCVRCFEPISRVELTQFELDYDVRKYKLQQEVRDRLRKQYLDLVGFF